MLMKRFELFWITLQIALKEKKKKNPKSNQFQMKMNMQLMYHTTTNPRKVLIQNYKNIKRKMEWGKEGGGEMYLQW